MKMLIFCLLKALMVSIIYAAYKLVGRNELKPMYYDINKICCNKWIVEESLLS